MSLLTVPTATINKINAYTSATPLKDLLESAVDLAALAKVGYDTGALAAHIRSLATPKLDTEPDPTEVSICLAACSAAGAVTGAGVFTRLRDGNETEFALFLQNVPTLQNLSTAVADVVAVIGSAGFMAALVAEYSRISATLGIDPATVIEQGDRLEALKNISVEFMQLKTASTRFDQPSIAWTGLAAVVQAAKDAQLSNEPTSLGAALAEMGSAMHTILADEPMMQAIADNTTTVTSWCNNPPLMSAVWDSPVAANKFIHTPSAWNIVKTYPNILKLLASAETASNILANNFDTVDVTGIDPVNLVGDDFTEACFKTSNTAAKAYWAATDSGTNIMYNTHWATIFKGLFKQYKAGSLFTVTPSSAANIDGISLSAADVLAATKLGQKLVALTESNPGRPNLAKEMFLDTGLDQIFGSHFAVASLNDAAFKEIFSDRETLDTALTYDGFNGWVITEGWKTGGRFKTLFAENKLFNDAGFDLSTFYEAFPQSEHFMHKMVELSPSYARSSKTFNTAWGRSPYEAQQIGLLYKLLDPLDKDPAVVEDTNFASIGSTTVWDYGLNKVADNLSAAVLKIRSIDTPPDTDTSINATRYSRNIERIVLGFYVSNYGANPPYIDGDVAVVRRLNGSNIIDHLLNANYFAIQKNSYPSSNVQLFTHVNALKGIWGLLGFLFDEKFTRQYFAGWTKTTQNYYSAIIREIDSANVDMATHPEYAKLMVSGRAISSGSEFAGSWVSFNLAAYTTGAKTIYKTVDSLPQDRVYEKTFLELIGYKFAKNSVGEDIIPSAQEIALMPTVQRLLSPETFGSVGNSNEPRYLWEVAGLIPNFVYYASNLPAYANVFTPNFDQTNHYWYEILMRHKNRTLFDISAGSSGNFTSTYTVPERSIIIAAKLYIYIYNGSSVSVTCSTGSSTFASFTVNNQTGSSATYNEYRYPRKIVEKGAVINFGKGNFSGSDCTVYLNMIPIPVAP